jgi:hypothetical protein
MGAFRRHRTLIAWFAIAALLGNLAAGLFSPAFGQRATSGWPADLLGPQVICTEHGDPAAVPDDGKAPTPATHCLLCITGPVFAFIVALAAAVLLLAPPANHARFAPQLGDTLTDRLRRAGLGSRAPPLPA